MGGVGVRWGGLRAFRLIVHNLNCYLGWMAGVYLLWGLRE